jgi:hypothetical protein
LRLNKAARFNPNPRQPPLAISCSVEAIPNK